MDILKIREDFPIFKKHPQFIYFDNAATTFKPQVVLDAIQHYYLNTANIGRGEYDLATNISKKVASTRKQVADFICAKEDEIIFTSGTSESLNMTAFCFGSQILQQDDVVLTTTFEHASSFLPWLQLSQQKNAKIEYIALDECGKIDFTAFEKQLHPKVKVIVIAHVSNVLGYYNDIEKICQLAHQKGIYVVVDAAQSSAHITLDVRKMDCDFLAFSAHKMYGPTGIGVLYGKKALLKQCVPFKYGGGSNARYGKYGDLVLKDIPYRFETGTLAIEAILGFSAALTYIQSIGIEAIHEREKALKDYFLSQLKKVSHIEIYNPDVDASTIIFNVKHIFAQDVASYLNSKNIAVRSGAHCAKNLDVFHTHATIRVSLSFYNTYEEIDCFIKTISNIKLEDTLDIFF